MEAVSPLNVWLRFQHCWIQYNPESASTKETLGSMNLVEIIYGSSIKIEQSNYLKHQYKAYIFSYVNMLSTESTIAL